MIRNKPKSTTSQTYETWTEQVMFISNAREVTRTAASRDALALATKDFGEVKTQSNSTRTQFALETFINHDTQWAMKSDPLSNFPVISDRKTSRSLRTDDVNEAKSLIYNWEKIQQGQIASFYSVYFVETMFRNRDYDEINRLLGEVDVAALTEWSMIALLRSSYQARAHLPAWATFLSNVLKKLREDGKDYNRLLSGLIR